MLKSKKTSLSSTSESLRRTTDCKLAEMLMSSVYAKKCSKERRDCVMKRRKPNV